MSTTASTAPRTVSADVYLIVKADRGYVGNREAGEGEPSMYQRVSAARVTGSRQSPPAKLARDEVAVKVRVSVPVAAFEPLNLGATADVPLELVLRRAVLDAAALVPEVAE